MKITKFAFCFSILLVSLSFGREYLVTEIPTFSADPSSQGVAYGINEAGMVVGSAQNNTGRYLPFLWTVGGGLVNLDTNTNPAGINYAVDVNDSGEICGTVAPFLSPTTYAFRSNGSDLKLMEMLANGRDGQGLGINSSGVIVGWSNENGRCGGPECLSSPGFAVQWVGTNISKVGGLGGYFSVAYGINDAGEICGYGAVPNGNAVHAFRIPPGRQPIDLGTLGGASSRAHAINNLGQIVGWAESSAENTNSNAVIWIDGVIQNLGQLPGKILNIAYAISDNGLVVGYSAGPDFAEARAAWFRRGSPPIDLNSLIDPNSGWTLQFATGVNTAGQISAYGTRNGVRRAALLIPNLEMRIGKLNGAQAEIRWSSFFVGYGIELSVDAVRWDNANLVPVLDQNEFVAMVQLSPESRFFRLRRL